MTQGIMTNLLKPINGSNISNIATNEGVGGSTIQGGLFSDQLSTAIEELLPINGNTDPLAAFSSSLETNSSLATDDLSLLPVDDLKEALLPISEQSISDDVSELLPVNLLPEKGLSQDSEFINLPETNKQLFDIHNKEATELPTLYLSRNKITSAFENQATQPLHKQGLEISNNAVLEELPISTKDITLKDTNLDLNDLKTHRVELLKSPDVTSLLDKPTGIQQVINPIQLNSNPNNDISTTITRRIDIPVQQSGWGDAVGSRLMMMVNDKVQSAHIHLNPPELGPIEVRVNVNHDQANVHFVSSHTAVRDAIEEAFPRLKEMFLQNGLTLADANVSQESADQGKAYSNNSMDILSDQSNESLDADAEIQVDAIHSDVSIGLVDHYV